MIFARLWWGMIGIMIGSTILTLVLIIAHRAQFMDACQATHEDAQQNPESCSIMYGSAVAGSIFGCFIGVTMIVSSCLFVGWLSIAMALPARTQKKIVRIANIFFLGYTISIL